MRRLWGQENSVSAALVGGLLGLAVSAPALARETPPPAWGTICTALEKAENDTQRVVAARSCALALEKFFGPDDTRLVVHFSEIADRLAVSADAQSNIAALPFRRRAHRTALRLFGRESPQAGRAALSYAKGKILAGRCERQSPEALGLLEDAAAGLGSDTGAARLAGMRDVARGFADSLAYERAAELLLSAGGPLGEQLQLQDWERVGLWRHRVGDSRRAANAYRNALRLDPLPQDRRRIRQSLRQALFDAGDFEALRALGR